jgi:hypothetical protein
LASLEVSNQAWTNLHRALQQLTVKVEDLPEVEEEEEEEDEPPPTKKSKLNDPKKKKRKKKTQKITVTDSFNLYKHTIRVPDQDELADPLFDNDSPEEEAAKELKSTLGGKLTQLTVSGILNGMAGHAGGLVINKHLEPVRGVNLQQIPTAMNIFLPKVKMLAAALHQAIQTRVETDVLVTTPFRIQDMLAPDLQPHEFKAIRRRIYETVILGKGLAQPEGSDIPTATSTGLHDLDKHKKCKSCGNNDQALFVLDRKNGDVICSTCGTVASESLMHEGSQFRKFEGEVDRNHHGDTANPLYSNAHNMSTTLGGVQITTGAGIGGFGSQKRGLETVLRNAHAYTELNISQFGKGDRRTRIGYKDKQKKDAFMQMAHCGDALNLHEAVVQRAKELFAGFRDDRELVQQFKGVIAACLCEAFDQLSSDGKQILKQIEEVVEENFHNPRANRRNELHHANLAGKGGLLLDFSAVKSNNKDEVRESSLAMKPATTWDLDDCRSWLLDASNSIAQQWIQDRKNGVILNNNNTRIPNGSQEELEGKLVEHAITLVNHLEAELKQQAKKQHGRGRVVTPRVNDMAKLGIKWQHAHERGSGGAGGVGNNKQVQQKTAAQSGRTAGQILILKTAKKLGSMLHDAMAGEAIHKELRSLVGKQEAQKRKLLQDESTRQRFAQMKRKPWLQARAQIEE